MKHYLTLLALLLPSFLCAQNRAEIDRQLEVLDSIANEQINAEQYDAAIATNKQAIALVEQNFGPNDTLAFIPNLSLSNVYRYQKDQANYELFRRRIVEIFEQGGHTESSDYPLSLAYLANCYWDLDLNAKADSVIERSLAIYDERMPNDDDMAWALSVSARIKNDLQQYDAAILNAQRSINIYESIYDTHYEDVISVLELLQTYYEAGGYAEQAQQTADKVQQLQQEKETGYVVPLPELKTNELCHQYRLEAFYSALYYINHFITAEGMTQAVQTVMGFTMNSDEVNVIFGIPESKWVGEEKNVVYLAAYSAANIVYALTVDEIDPAEQYLYSICKTIDFYSANKKLTGEVPHFEEYLALFQKDSDKLIDRINKDYKAFAKEQKKGNVTKGIN